VIKPDLRTPSDPTTRDPAPCQRACREQRVQSEWRPPVQNSGCRIPRPEWHVRLLGHPGRSTESAGRRPTVPPRV